MEICAKYFGTVQYEKEDVIHIPGGLIGFESYTRFLTLAFQEEDDSLISLQSLEDPELSFILMNPFSVFPDYDPRPSAGDLRELGTDKEQDISYYAVSVIRETAAQSTVNLKAPVAINALNKRGKQIMLEDSSYSFRQPLAASGKEA